MSAPRLRSRLSLGLQVVAVGICIAMATIMRGQSSDIKIAVLQTRADQIDAHLTNTDNNIRNLDEKIDRLAQAIAEMQGSAETERWAGWSVCGLLSGSSMLVGLKRKREE